MDVKITLRRMMAPIPGTHAMSKPLKQCMVYANGKQVALYCGDELKPATDTTAAEYEKGKYLSFVNSLFEFSQLNDLGYDEVVKETVRQITEMTGAAPFKVDLPPNPWGGDLAELTSSQIIVSSEMG